MSQKPLRTALIGFGKIAQGYASDRTMARYFSYATHAQVLQAHPEFLFDSVVDPSEQALAEARSSWKVKNTARHVRALSHSEDFDVAVIAVPPEERLDVLDALPSVKGIIVEKPLGSDLQRGRQFLKTCARRKILVQVNLLRRADRCMRELADGGLSERIGEAQAAFGIYGNGLLNNGTHLIDLIRMLLGEVVSVTAMTKHENAYSEGPLAGDLNFPLSLQLMSGVVVALQPVRFVHYREHSLDIWGSLGRLTIAQSGLITLQFPIVPNRALQQSNEVASDKPSIVATGLGTAMYDLYSNFADALRGRAELLSPGFSALQTAQIVECAFTSLRNDCRRVRCNSDENDSYE